MKRIFYLAAVITLVSAPAWGDELYIGLTVSGKSGEPDFDEQRPAITAAYEAKKTWRISYASGDYEHVGGKVGLDTTIIGVERMFIYEMGKSIYLIGSFGPALFNATISTDTSSEKGSAVGLLATGNFRVYLSDAFFDLGYHYRNAAVIIDSSSFNGGYEGPVLGMGLAF
ncbi:MAG: hypothetical protein OEZ59_12795 [Deltaproteobacteria bacterium]|nr:hypothetical protein [Deltaproteobacteria bacterium]